MGRFAVAPEEAQAFRVAWQGIGEFVCAQYGAVGQPPEIDKGICGALVVQAEDGQHALLAQQVLDARRPLGVAPAQGHDEGRDRAGPDVNCLAGDVVARVDSLGPDMALLAIHGRSGSQGCVSRGSGREAVDRRGDLSDAADGVLQLPQRLLGLLQFGADALPVLPLSAPMSSATVALAHLSGQRHSPAVDVDHAVGEVMPVLPQPHAYPLRRRMQLARRVVGT